MKPYIPGKLPLKTIDWGSHVSLIGQAREAVGHFDGILRSIPNQSIFLSPLTTQEAVVSSQIEGSQATLYQILEFEAMPKREMSPEKRDDFQEVVNYRLALIQATEELEHLPLSLRLVRNSHRTLLKSTRGKNKTPGSFRRVQNYIAPHGEPIENATFVPPNINEMEKALDNWEKYLHYDENDPLVQLALIKAQFELIHPFLDGNGRIGRLLIPLIMFEKKLLASPSFYLSSYLNQHREEYYARLNSISQNGDWDGWISFFLRAISEQAIENSKKVLAILQLYSGMKENVFHATNSKYAIHILDAIFAYPIFRSTDFRKHSGIPTSSVRTMLNRLEDKEIIVTVEKASGSRPAMYLFPKLLAITEA